MSTAADWLKDEDFRCFKDRLSRLEWLSKNSPGGEFWIFPGGILAKSLFEETRYCFVYGQFLATILLGLAYIERTLAALFYGSGRSDLKRASLSALLKVAYSEGVIRSNEFEDMERIRKKRNSYAHFRKPLDKESVDVRALHEDEAPYKVIEQDSTAVMVTALKLVAKNAV